MTQRNLVWWPNRRHARPAPRPRIWTAAALVIAMSLLVWAACGAWMISDHDVDAWSHRAVAEVRP